MLGLREFLGGPCERVLPQMSDVSTAPRMQGAGQVSVTPTILMGLLGSILVMAGSYGVGWLAMSSPINRWKWLVPWRTEFSGLICATIVLTIGAWMLVGAWLALGRKLRPWGSSLKPLIVATAVWSLPLMFAAPVFSRDVFAYIGQGRIVAGGGNPYELTISSMNNWLQLGADATWAESQTAYGPLFYWIAAAVVSVTGVATEPAIFGFRILAWLGIILLIVYVPKLAAVHGVNPVKATWYAVANPVVLLSFIASAHNDALMVGLAVAASYSSARRLGLLAIVLLVASVGIKPITLVLLPYLGLLWAGPASSWPRKIRYWAYSAVLAVALLALMGLPGHFGFGWIQATLAAGGGYYNFYAPLGAVVAGSTALLTVLSLDGSWVLGAVQKLGRLAALIVIAITLFRGSYRHLVQRLLIGFSALVVLSPVIHPWYLLWLLPFFAATGIRDDWQALWMYVSVGFFVALGCFDQLFVWQFFAHLKGVLQVISIGVSVLAFVLIAWVIPPTKAMFADTLKPRDGRIGGLWRVAK